MVKLTYIVNPNVDWCYLSGNSNAIHLLEQNLDKIDWTALSGNPNAKFSVMLFKYYQVR